MANQIAAFFAHEGEARAVADTADHLAKFWDPRMRAAILEHLDAGGEELGPIARRAVAALRDISATR